VLFDTGSGGVVLPSSACEAKACAAHRRYDRAASASAQDRQGDGSVLVDRPGVHRDTQTVQFGTGELTGVYVSDKVCVGTLCADVRMTTALNETDAPFAAYAFDGILGLGLDADPDASFVQSLVKAKTLRAPVFALFLADSGPSEVTFGGASPRRQAGQLVYFPVTGDAGYWQVDVADLTVGGAKLGVGATPAVLDSGTSQIAGPTNLVVAIVEKIDVPEDCSNLDALPKLGFVLGNKVLELSAADYVDAQDGKCSLALMPMDGPGVLVLGEPFLRKFYTVYDAKDRRVGFAPARQADSVAASLVDIS